MKTKLVKLLTASILLMGGVEAVNATKIMFVENLKNLKNIKGSFTGQLALVDFNNRIVKYIWNGKYWKAMQDTIEAGAPSNGSLGIYKSCKAIKMANPSAKDGVYTIDPDGEGSEKPFKVYCDMTTDGGGWTLVWSNLRGGSGKYETGMKWNTAINTKPLVKGRLGDALDKFQVFIGLKYWNMIGDEFRYTWASDGTKIDQAFKANIRLEGDNYTLKLSNYVQLKGSTTAGIWSRHNNQPFSTIDADHDSYYESCSYHYSKTPFWYSDCWDGSINGGGESSGDRLYNGAYWVSSDIQWGHDNGRGAGNGWMWIR